MTETSAGELAEYSSDFKMECELHFDLSNFERSGAFIGLSDVKGLS